MSFLRKNQKKILAVVTAFLMVVFILDFAISQRFGNQRTDPVVAYLGDDERITASEAGLARQEWDLLKRASAHSPQMAIALRRSPFEPIPFTMKLGYLALEIDEHPELFLLLQKEALRNGIRVSPARVDAIIDDPMLMPPRAGAENKERMRHAVEGFLLVQALYDRFASNVKVSEPVVEKAFAGTGQEVSLNLVELTADQFKAATTAPTEQEVQEHFKKYANTPAGLSTTNPADLGFGYQLPNRVKLQYLSVNRDQLRAALRKTKDDYAWEVEARRYYLANPRAFPVTQPTLNATNPATAPTTRPFEEVREEVLNRVMGPELDKFAAQVRGAIEKRLRADFDKFGAKSANASTAPAGAAAPAATQPGQFASFGYLEQVAADVQKQFGVLPAATSKSDQWMTADELGELPGIGRATRSPSGDSFTNYVLQSAEAFMPVPAKADAASVLSIYEPSDVLEDFNGNLYFFRLTDAQAARAPTDLAEVRDKVVADLTASRGYAKVRDEAQKLLEAAKKDGLPAAAAAAKREVIPTGSFDRGMYGFGPTTIPNYPVDFTVRQRLVQDAFDLLSKATPDAPHPVAMIDLPTERKVLVAELRDVTSRAQGDREFANRLFLHRQVAFNEAQELAMDWFSARSVKSRLGYRLADDEAEERERKEAAEASAASARMQ